MYFIMDISMYDNNSYDIKDNSYIRGLIYSMIAYQVL